MGLFFTNGSMHSQLTGYSNNGYLSDSHVGKSQIGYVLLVGGTTISWRSTKQTFAATSSNHVEILALHEASWECLLLQCLIRHNGSSCGFIGPHYQQLSMKIVMLALINSRRASLKVIESNIFLSSFSLLVSSMIIISTFNLLHQARTSRIFLPKAYLHQNIGWTFLLLDSKDYQSRWAKTMMMRWGGVLWTHACNESCYTYLMHVMM